MGLRVNYTVHRTVSVS